MQHNPTQKMIDNVNKLFYLLIIVFLIPGKLIAQVYVNGNISTGTMTATNDLAPAGYLWSEVQAGNTIAGFDGNIAGNRTVADDFTIPSGTWNISKFTSYAFANGYPGYNSPLNDIRIRIYDTDPSIGNPTPVFGDLISNRYSSTYTTHIYRIQNAVSALDKQIWKIEANISVSLSAGTYWIEWQIGSTLPDTYIPLSTVAGTVTQPGNNAKTNLLPNSWSNLTDGSNPQDLPFRIDYNTGPCSGTPAPGNTLTTLMNPCAGVEFELSVQNPPAGSGINYQWQYSYDGISFTNIFTGTNSLLEQATIVGTYYRAQVGCGADLNYSNAINIIPNPPANCYCLPHIADCAGGASITNVTVNALSNSSGCAVNGYTNYGLDAGVITPVISTGVDVPLFVTVGPGSANKTVAVWIDFDRNGFFDNFNYYDMGTTTGGTLSGVINLPANTAFGFTKMRVRVSSGVMSSSDACTTYLSGETEDYVVDVNTASSPCSGIPSPGNTITSANPVCQYEPFTLSLQNTGNGSGTTYQWLYSNDNITYYELSGVTGNSFTQNNLPSLTYFKALVRCGGDTASSIPVLMQLKDPAVCYAIPPASDCSGGNEITNVSIGTLNNNSACSTGGYTDYSSDVSVNVPYLVPATSIPITITGGIAGAKVGIWIDYDHDGYLNSYDYTFIGTTTASPITSYIYFPNPAYQGPTRMRVRLESSEPMDGTYANYNYTNSETEDYVVNLNNCYTNFIYQPESATLCEGSNYTFFVTATGPGLTYQWQQSVNGCGGSFTDIPNATSTTYTITNFSAAQNNYGYRCILSGTCATVISNCATVLLATMPSFILQPHDATVCAGGTAVFSAAILNYPVLSYQWQVNTGTVWVNLPADTSLNLIIPSVSAAMNGYQYQLLAFACSGTPVVSNTVTLTINGSPIITQQPISITTCAGSAALFYVSPGGIDYTYQWQVSTNSGATFNNIPGATGDSVYINPVMAGDNGNQYQVVVSAPGCTGITISAAATLMVTSPVLTQQPLPLTICENQIAHFNSTATGNPVNYQWQVSTDDGISFSDLAFAQQSSLEFYASPLMNGYRYRVTVSGCGIIIYSDAATLTVNAMPFTIITANPPVTTLLPGESTVLTAAVTPPGTYNYFWRLEGVDIPGATASSYTVNYGSPGYYSVVTSNVSGGCLDTTGIVITDSADGGRYAPEQLYVYSNPNNGIFTVRYQDLPAQSSLAVHDIHGTRIMSRANLPAGQPVQVDIHTASSGIYTIALYVAGKHKIVRAKVLITH